MKNKTLTVALMFLTTFIISVTAYASNTNIIANLDDENVTVEILTSYVEDVAGKNYEPWLHDKEGLRKLADFYINRTLLLDYARKSVDKKNTIVTNHNARSMDADVMLLSSLLQSEVQDKVQVTEDVVGAYMEMNGLDSKKEARQKMESKLKNELMTALIAKVRVGHSIQYFP
jgi:hypothetical protein